LFSVVSKKQKCLKMPNEKGFIIEEIMEKDVNRTNHILGIAINDYKYCPKLNNAVKDVTDFINLMVNRFEFETKNIHPLYNQDATGKNITKKLDELSSSLTENDNLIIYFSGHGALHPLQGKGFWIPVEAEQDDYFGYLANTVIKDYLSTIKAHHIFLIADSCFSGALFTKGVKDVGKRLEKNPSRWGLTSGQKEIVLDGEPGENSPFAKSLLYHLANTTQPIGVQTLCSNVLETTAANAYQTPLGEPLQVEGHKNGQFVFRLKKDEISDWTKAQKVGTVAALQQFLAVYPNGQFAETATNEIKNINTENAWKRIENSTHSVDFARYKKEFPKSKYFKEAHQRFLIIEEDEVWQRTKMANILSHYDRYLMLYPNGRYVAEANAATHAIFNAEKEPDAWRKAEAQNTTKAYQAYLAEFPNGKNALNAQQKIKFLETQAQAQAKEKAAKVAQIQKDLEKKRLAEKKAAANKEKWQTLQTLVSVKKLPLKPISIAAAILLLIWIGATSNLFQTDFKPVVEETQLDPFANQMIKIPSGTFQMGSNEYEWEQPTHTVTLDSFYMSQYEVTQKQWRDIMGTNPSYFKDCDNCPVEQVSWDDIQEFLKKLNTQTGKNYRLPTEAEWEYAARGGQKFNYAGSNNIDNVAWYWDNAGEKTHPVGQKSPNGYGLYDMSGNVWEWCQDVWHDNYNGAPTNGSAWTSGGNSASRVLRGGSWSSSAGNCRSAFRLGNTPDDRSNSGGFRIAL
jgi:formylglycine-generating enzyme required for sulfatase activity